MAGLGQDARTTAAHAVAATRQRAPGEPAIDDGSDEQVRVLLEGLAGLPGALEAIWVGWGRSGSARGDFWSLFALTTTDLVGVSHTTRVSRATVVPLASFEVRASGGEIALFIGSNVITTFTAPAAASLQAALNAGPRRAPASAAPAPVSGSTTAAVVDTWQEAEGLAVWHMRTMGFTGVALTVGGADGGVDVSADGAVAQVKFTSAPIGGPVVQQLRGAAHAAKHALFYSLSGYTTSAVAFGDAAGVALFTFDRTAGVSAANTTGRHMLAERGGSSSAPASELARATSKAYEDLLNQAVQLFTHHAGVALQDLPNGAAGDDIVAAVRQESHALGVIVDRIGSGTQRPSAVSAGIQEILAAATRVEALVANDRQARSSGRRGLRRWR